MRTLFPAPNGSGRWKGDIRFDRGDIWYLGQYPVPGPQSDTTGPVTVYVEVLDPDFQGQIAVGQTGPVTVKVVRQGKERILFTAGGQVPHGTELGPIPKKGSQPGDFETKFILTEEHGLREGDQLLAEYRDATRLPSGEEHVAKRSAIFAFHEARLSSKSFNPWDRDRKKPLPVAFRGHDIEVWLDDSDLNRDSEVAETIPLRQIEVTTDDGLRTTLAHPAFNGQPDGMLMEIGDNMGIFGAVIKMPKQIDGVFVQPGTEFRLKYKDRVAADRYIPIQRSHFSANFGFSIELDQKEYGSGQKVDFFVIAPDFSSRNDEEGGTVGAGYSKGDFNGVLNISAGGKTLGRYALIENELDGGRGRNFGVFRGSIQLSRSSPTGGAGPDGGVLQVAPGDTLSMTFDDGSKDCDPRQTTGSLCNPATAIIR